MPLKKQGRAGKDRAAKKSVHSNFSQFEQGLLRAGSAITRGWPPDANWTPTMRRAMACMVRCALRLLAARPDAREFYYYNHRLHLRRFDGWLMILDSRMRPLIGPFRLPATAPRRQRKVVQP